jgi:hypothetical protein
MFFREAQGFRRSTPCDEARGVLLFNVWDRIEENAFAHTVTQTLTGMFPDKPPVFLRARLMVITTRRSWRPT